MSISVSVVLACSLLVLAPMGVPDRILRPADPASTPTSTSQIDRPDVEPQWHPSGRVTTGEPERDIVARTNAAHDTLDPLNALTVAEGDMGFAPRATGEVTRIDLPKSVTTVKVHCELPNFRFTYESLANRSPYLPGIKTYATSGVERVSRSYSVARGGSDFIVQASQSPSETLAHSYQWYERSFDLLALQGLFLTVRSPAVQQESAYRLFAAGATLGLAGAFLVAAMQTAIESSSEV